MAHGQRLFSSEGLLRDQIDLGTTPNMAPPSNLKKPVSTVKSSMYGNKKQSTNWGLYVGNMKIGKIYSTTTPIAQNFSIRFEMRSSASILSNSAKALPITSLRVLAIPLRSL
jgi:hypothetical protein